MKTVLQLKRKWFAIESKANLYRADLVDPLVDALVERLWDVTVELDALMGKKPKRKTPVETKVVADAEAVPGRRELG